jgi:hypothetical protein
VLSLHVHSSSLLRLSSAQLHIVELAAILCLTCAISCSTAHAQTAGTGALSGIVTDPSGASIADAQISVISEATGERRTSTSAPNGIYLVALLLPSPAVYLKIHFLNSALSISTPSIIPNSVTPMWNSLHPPSDRYPAPALRRASSSLP